MLETAAFTLAAIGGLVVVGTAVLAVEMSQRHSGGWNFY